KAAVARGAARQSRRVAAHGRDRGVPRGREDRRRALIRNAKVRVGTPGSSQQRQQRQRVTKHERTSTWQAGRVPATRGRFESQMVAQRPAHGKGIWKTALVAPLQTLTIQPT